MPKLMQLKAGITVYIEGDTDERIFILQSGSINLVYTDIETGKIRRDIIQQGEFFGVKSALGKYPREETANVAMDSTVIAFNIPEFEATALKNPRLIMQMLKVYSNQLRKISRLLSGLQLHARFRSAAVTQNLESGSISADDGLFRIGEYYLRLNKYNEARYVFGKYMQNYPQGSHIFEVKSRIAGLGAM
jgi:CRP-like cAMP-binding protein